MSIKRYMGREDVAYILYTEREIVYWASLVAQLVKKPPAMRETWVRSLDWEDPLKK